jgi:phosphohistidine phosphatase
MRLTLLRHGPAVERDAWTGADADRPLTEDGSRRTQAMLTSCASLVKADRLWVSPYLRARSTADLATKTWRLRAEDMPWLVPGAATAAQRLAHLAGAGDVVLVGHEPDLGELIGAALGGPAIPLAKAGFAVLEGEPVAGGMALRLLLTPKAVGRLR